MSVKDRLNGRGERKFNVKLTEDVVYAKLKDIYPDTTNIPLQILGAYVKDSKYGETASLICGSGRGVKDTSNLVVNLPSHLLADVKEMISDSECINDINNGNASFHAKTYMQGENIRYTVRWLIGEDMQRDDITEWANENDVITKRIKLEQKYD